MFNFFNRNQNCQVNESDDPYQDVTSLIDQLNDAMKDLKRDPEYKHLRLYVQSGNIVDPRSPKLMIGFWEQGARSFKVIYPPEY